MPLSNAVSVQHDMWRRYIDDEVHNHPARADISKKVRSQVFFCDNFIFFSEKLKERCPKIVKFDSTAIRPRSDYDVSRAPASIRRRDSTRAKNEHVYFSS